MTATHPYRQPTTFQSTPPVKFNIWCRWFDAHDIEPIYDPTLLKSRMTFDEFKDIISHMHCKECGEIRPIYDPKDGTKHFAAFLSNTLLIGNLYEETFRTRIFYES